MKSRASGTIAVASRQVELFAREWSLQPHRWWYERDVAAEISRRISDALGPRRSKVPFDDLETYSEPHCSCGHAGRVRIDHPIYGWDKVRYPKRPDIVIHPDDPEDPYPWVCEIKVGSTPRKDLNGVSDEEKVLRLLGGPRPVVLAGTVLDMRIPTPPRLRGSVSRSFSLGGRLTKYFVEARQPNPNV